MAEPAASPSEVQAWLEWAGAKLLALGLTSPAPALERCAWPDYANETSAYGYTGDRLRAGRPSRADITLMDEIQLLPGLIPDLTVRRIIQARSLVTPVANKYVYSWAKIGLMIHGDRKTAARLHATGLYIICRKVAPEKASTIRQSFTLLST